MSKAKKQKEVKQPIVKEQDLLDPDLPSGTSGSGEENEEGETLPDTSGVGQSSEEGIQPVTSESPQEPTISTEGTSDDVAKENFDVRTGSGVVTERKLIGQHPVTGRDVYEDEL